METSIQLHPATFGSLAQSRHAEIVREVASFRALSTSRTVRPERAPTGRKANIALWVAQGALAAIFLFAGASKFVMSAEEMTKDTDLPLWFFRFIGTCEVLGAIGLVLPWTLRIKSGLTPLAAAGLVIIMIGATVLTVATLGAAAAIFPCVVGVLALTVAVGRRSDTRPAKAAAPVQLAPAS
jgi:uncharacterized membrane protein YphA (DoxX/SURF4 family)